MGINTLLIYIIASIILTIILNNLERKKKDNIIDYIIISNIYILILSGILNFYKLNSDNIFIIILFSILGKIFYETLIKERTILKNNNYNLSKYLLSLSTSYLLNILIINRVDNIFPSDETIKLLIWLFIACYFLIFIKNNIDIKVPATDNIPYYQDREYLVMQYAKYKNKYYNLINTKYKELNLLTFSILIYENYHKPEFIRKLDIIKYRLFREEVAFGIMQLKRKNPISDEESIKFSLKKLEKIYITNSKINSKELEIIKKTTKKYYQNDNKEVECIYKVLKSFNDK